ncbi:nucleic acid-binding protein [Aaosphaeria arxii CBS 175.79]|uniref:rRNA biogenesis protein RRP5 n=1 Tax=Aaosphaeria arxii CBS 175.79 TaxID=1450172 RepID=A0A6A5XE67_9PLEO|nr:nucleic acid-binding protein [Aaosphaeria arxii CBS 175.79]KAF2011475.1 nucleic acid-binding protein [Aaosphaeria arxii CBS 175.79]
MAPIKRKAEGGNAPAKKEKISTTDRSSKRRRTSDAAADNAKPANSKSSSIAQKSVFNEEEKSFPRGGASVLTPLEHKQIQVKANQDVLFEQAGLKPSGAGDSDGAESDFDVDMEDAPKASKKKKKSKKGKKNDNDEDVEKIIKVESLSFKRLAQGTMVLGQVAEITSRDIVLALPNNLVGYVPLTAISDKMNEKIEKLIAEEEPTDEGGSDSEDSDELNLEDMFYVGQYLRARVTATGDDSVAEGSTKKRIELSVQPSLVNGGIEKSSIVANTALQASVRSKEDHGLIMDMGVDDPKLSGFLAKSELDPKMDFSKVQEGSVFLCYVSGTSSNGRIIKLSSDHQKFGNLKKLNHVSEAPTIDVFLPGTAVDLLVTDSTATTVTGKIMGSLDATADVIHSGSAFKGDDVSEKYKIGSRAKARIICTFPGADPKKVGISMLDHIVALAPCLSGKPKEKKDPLTLAPLSSFIEEAKVIKVEPRSGVYFDIGIRDVSAFAHISRLTDGKIEVLSDDSGPFKLGAKHRARILGYNSLDAVFQLSLETKVLEQPFLRVQDIKVGQVVKGKVHKIINDRRGFTNLLVNLAENITGLVPEIHLADVRLQHPERKFREGASVTARVLSIDYEKRNVQLTLKKSLVNSDIEPWTDYSAISVGDKGVGTLVDVQQGGAIVRFYGDVTAWLPAAEMSEAYIEDATKQFKKGSVVNVRVISIDPKAERMLVSCKDPDAVDPEKDALFRSLTTGDIVRGTVIEKSDESITADLGHGVKGVLRIGQLTDGSEKKDKATMAKVRVGGPIEDVVVLDKHDKSRTVTLSNKPSLRKAAQSTTLITKFQDIQTGQVVHGFVRGILPNQVFVEFAGGVVGLLFSSQIPDEMRTTVNFGLRRDQSITARVTHVDVGQARFWLSMRSETDPAANFTTPEVTGEATVNAVDDKVKSTTDLQFGTSLNVRVKSVKDTQVNVQVSDNVQGRISVAELFNNWDEIKDKKRPLAQFKANDIISAQVLGAHDARNHRFLPITHRQGKVPIFELTAKKAELKSKHDVLALEKIKSGSSHIAFINNIADRYVWVNISANVRGRIAFLDLSDDLSLLSDVEANFPLGSALKVRVKAVDTAAGRLDLTATSVSAKSSTLKDMKPGLILPARVTKVTGSSIIVQINENIAGPIYQEHLADDYDLAKPTDHKPGEVIRVCVTEVDLPNKKLGLSARPSRVLSSSLPIKDVEIKDKSELKVQQVVRGFIKRFADNGVFVRLGPHVDAFVKIANLSDSYIKDWKSGFQIDELVQGKIIAAGPDLRTPQMSLKKSIVEGNFAQLLEFSDMTAGQIVTAKVRKVQDYGVFLVVDNSQNVSGLCHVSELADKRVSDVKSLYKEGDVVKAKILSVDTGKRRISFGLKYSYVREENEEDSDEEMGSGDEDDEDASDSEDLDDEDIEMRSVKDAESDEEDIAADAESESDNDDEVPETSALTAGAGLSTSGFDWTGATLDFDEPNAAAAASSDDEGTKKKKKSKKATIKEDRTGDLDAYGPQSVADYERLLLGQPNSAELWVRYMVFQRELNEIDKARQIARRALATMNTREEKERLDIWTALLHLENEHSSDDTVEETFKEARQNNDDREIHERMIKIYISSGKLDKADELYQSMMKNKSFTPTTSFWLSFASFLFSTLQPPSPARARALLPRATQSVPTSEHRYLTTKFAALEFKSPNGDAERGRTIFEGLVDTWPKKGDLWDTYLSLELSHGSENNVRDLFERMSKQKMKKKRAATVFKRWRDWEVKVGNKKGVEKVKSLEKEWKEKKEEGDEQNDADE